MLKSKSIIKDVIKQRGVKEYLYYSLAHFVKKGCGDDKRRYLYWDFKKAIFLEKTILKLTKDDILVLKKYIN